MLLTICIRKVKWPIHISVGKSVTLTDITRNLPQFLHTNAGKASQIMPQTTSFKAGKEFQVMSQTVSFNAGKAPQILPQTTSFQTLFPYYPPDYIN